MLTRFSTREWLVANWFLVILPVLLLVSYLFNRSLDWGGRAIEAEAVTVFDWCVSVPFLYFLCYRKALPLRQMLVRLAALACLGIWIAGRMVPAASQVMLPELGWLRWAGLIVMTLIELRLFVAVLKLAFSGSAKVEDLEKTGAPPLLAKLMLMEARFWRAVWRLIRGR
jgi:hypothetical protein